MKKKILFFGKLPPPYIGPSFATRVILESKLTSEFNIIHFDTSHHSSLELIGKKNIKNLIFPFYLYARFIKKLFQINPDIVYMPSQQSTITYLRDLPFILISKIFNIKIICHLRGGYFLNWYNESSELTKWLIRKVQKLIDGQIVLGDNLKKLYEPFMEKNKIFVIPNGGDFDFTNVKISNEKLIKILFLGNMIKTKGVIDFIKAAQRIDKKYKNNLIFQLAGEHYDCENEINNLIKSSIDSRIEYLGLITGDEKKSILANSDIFVFPTYYRNEGHPWVIVEALAAGLPIISTDRGAIIESVIENFNGYIVNPQSPKQLANKIIKLVDNESLRNQMANNSKEIYKEKFTLTNLVTNFSKVFNSVLSKSHI